VVDIINDNNTVDDDENYLNDIMSVEDIDDDEDSAFHNISGLLTHEDIEHWQNETTQKQLNNNNK
jgi:hypothetical protein